MKDLSRLNVQEQIALKKKQILAEAKYWRLNGLPSPVEQFLRKEGIDSEKSIVLDYEQDYPGISTDEGKILTARGEFFEFKADLDPKRTKLIELHAITNITDRFEINKHKKGVGRTYGDIAMEVLRELNENECKT